jgi:hypothetical protein
MRDAITLWVLLPIWALCLVGGATIIVVGMAQALWFLLGPHP